MEWNIEIFSFWGHGEIGGFDIKWNSIEFFIHTWMFVDSTWGNLTSFG